MEQSETSKTVEKHATTLNLLTIENQSLANMFKTFLITHSIFLGCLMGYVLNKDFEVFMHWNPCCFVFCCLGFLFSILWFFAYLRGSTYFVLWKAEAKKCAPQEWSLYSAEEELQRGNIKNGVKLFFKCLTLKLITYILIVSFALTYFAGMFFFAPCWNV